MADQVRFSFPIHKFDRTPDGDIVVYGKCTDGSVDADHQIVDPKWSAKALDDWLKSAANMRVQHSPFLYPAGKGMALELDRDGDGGHWLKALVVEDTAKKLVEKKVLQDFSIGILDPRIVFDSPMAPGGRIVGGHIGEVSLVDRGSNKGTTFEIAKSLGSGVQLVTKTVNISPMGLMALSGSKKGQPVTTIEKKKLKSGKIVDSSGKDRSHVPSSQFAGPGSTYPIENEGDVSDAASLAHHADNPEAVRRRIRNIATDKLGMSKDELPPSVKADASCPTCHGDGKIRGNSMTCPDCHGTGKATAETADKSVTVYKGDAGEDYPGDKGEDEDTVADYDSDEPDGDEDEKPGKKSDKALRKVLRRQRRVLKAEAQRGNNGGRAPSEVHGKPDPDAAESGFSSAKDKNMVPAGKHREPDGPQAEGIEEDAGMHSTDESGNVTGVPGSDWEVRKSAPSYGLQRLHDAVCPAYQWRDVRRAYSLPKSVMSAVPVREIESMAIAALEKGSLGEAEYFTAMLKVASEIQTIGPDLLIDARKALPAMFPDTKPAQHSDVRPSMFQRGYVSAGHPSLSAGSENGHSPLPRAQVHEVSAQDFRRGYLSAGHSSNSPGEGAQARSGTAAFGQALNTMTQMHQRVSQLWPDMCPINVTQRDYTTGEGQTGIRPGQNPTFPAAPGERGITKKQEAVLRKSLAKAQSKIKALEDEVALLGSLPDPEHAPYRGLPQLDGPVDRESYVDKALGSGGSKENDGDAEFLQFVQGLAATGDPGMRLAASKVVRTMLEK